MTSHCQERLILLDFVPVDSNLHFSLVKHLVPCVTTKDWLLFFFFQRSSLCCTLPSPCTAKPEFLFLLDSMML